MNEGPRQCLTRDLNESHLNKWLLVYLPVATYTFFVRLVCLDWNHDRLICESDSGRIVHFPHKWECVVTIIG